MYQYNAICEQHRIRPKCVYLCEMEPNVFLHLDWWPRSDMLFEVVIVMIAAAAVELGRMGGLFSYLGLV